MLLKEKLWAVFALFCFLISNPCSTPGDPTLLCPGEATSTALCPVLDSSVQERQGTSTDSPEEGYKDDEGPGASPL